MPESVAQATLKVQVTGINQGSSAVKGFQDTVTRSMTASEKSVASAIGSMIAQYAGLAVAIRQATKVMSSGVAFNKFVENQTMSFAVMMKSAEAAKKQMEDLYDFAVNSPLTFKESAGSAKQLMAYGFAAKELVPTMKMLGSVAIATGNSLGDISYVYGTLRSQGRAYSRDLMQFGMRGIPIYEELAKVMGVSANEIQKMASQGKIGFKEVEQAFRNMTSNGGKFAGILEGYMATLTGKLSMLSDIAEQTAGNLMKPTTTVIKDAVDQITKQFQSSSFQDYIKDLGKDLGSVAKALSTILTITLKLLPAITTFVKLWMLFKGLQLAKEVLGKLPALLFGIGDSLVKVGVAMNGFSAASVTMATTLNTAFASATTGLKLFMAELVTFIAANPWILALVGVTAAVAGITSGAMKAHERNKTSSNPNVRANELAVEYATKAYSATEGTSIPVLTAEDVKKIAEEYQLAEGTTARILINSGALEESSWKQYINNKSSTQAIEEYKKVQEGLLHTSKTQEQEQMEFLSGLTGLPASIYEDFSNVDLNALGNQGAKDYIAGFAQARDKEKDIFGAAYTAEMFKKSLQEEAEGIEKALREGANIKGLFDTNYDETLRKRLMQIGVELDGIGKKVEKLPTLSKWWLPEESAVATTMSSIDDAQLAMKKALYNAEQEVKNRRDIMQLNQKNSKSILDWVHWQEELNKLKIEEKQITEDITKAQEKLVNVSRYNEYTGQSNALFTDLQANAGQAFQNAIDAVDLSTFMKNMGKGIGGIAAASTQGTEGGSAGAGFAAGGVVGLIASLATSLIKLMSNIENVGKALNGITTIWDALKGAANVEALMNNAFKPIVQHLQQLGRAIAPVVAIISGFIKIANALAYITTTVVLIPLQMLGAAFRWLYNSVIVPVGNMTIKIVNAVIKALNKLPFVSIEYLDALEKMTDATEDYSEVAQNAQDSLGATISYLEDKLREIYDKQLESIQDLYEVGALSATQYEKMVNDLNATRLDQDPLVSLADEQLTEQRAILARLRELYNLQILTEQNDLTEAQIASLLTQHGLTADSLASKMSEAIALAIKNIDTASGNGSFPTGVTDPITGLPPGLIPGGPGGPGTPGTTTTGTEPRSGTPSTFTLTNNQIDSIIASYKNIFDKMRVDDITSYYKGLGYPGQSAYSHAKSLMSSYSKAKNAFYTKWNSYGIANDYAGFTSAQQEFINTWGKYTPAFATGTSQVPRDMIANIHKDEGIIPKTFMDSIRSGELTLGGRNQVSGQTTVININIEGTVVAENDLVESISGTLYKMRSKGLVTV